MKTSRKRSRGIVSWPAKERPRERLLAEGPERLTDADLLAILGIRHRKSVYMDIGARM